MLPGVRSRRAWIYVLSIAALLEPAGGIAYLGAVSYGAERGAVSAQHARQRDAALARVARIDRAVEEALDAVERAAAGATESVDAARGGPAGGVLGRYWFWIDAERQLRFPRPAPRPELSGALERGGCHGLPDDECFRELEQRSAHMSRLRAAQRAEAM